MAIAMARQGGIGILHRNLSIAEQAAHGRPGQAQRVGHDHQPGHDDARRHRRRGRRAVRDSTASRGLPVVDADGTLVGIITNRDMRFVSRLRDGRRRSSATS